MQPITVVRRVQELRELRERMRDRGESVALVPTMGALHEGHLALIRAGQARCAHTIATIFVNPSQFGPEEDYASYPRDEEGDLAKLAAVGAAAAFIPPVTEMYRQRFATSVRVAGLSDVLCGRFRPGHFAGVATVVTKLLLQALPDVALFGEKDYQQLQIIRRLVADLDIPVSIVGVATVRAPDGLALSSRNAYLSQEQRRIAPGLFLVLSRLAEQLAERTNIGAVIASGIRELQRRGFDSVDYLELRHAETLEPLSDVGEPARLFAAAYLGGTRLIDNVPVA